MNNLLESINAKLCCLVEKAAEILAALQNLVTPPATSTIQTRYCDPGTCEHVATVLDICIVPVAGPSTEIQKIKGPDGSELAAVPAGAVECSECEGHETLHRQPVSLCCCDC